MTGCVVQYLFNINEASLVNIVGEVVNGRLPTLLQSASHHHYSQLVLYIVYNIYIVDIQQLV